MPGKRSFSPHFQPTPLDRGSCGSAPGSRVSARVTGHVTSDPSDSSPPTHHAASREDKSSSSGRPDAPTAPAPSGCRTRLRANVSQKSGASRAGPPACTAESRPRTPPRFGGCSVAYARRRARDPEAWADWSCSGTCERRASENLAAKGFLRTAPSQILPARASLAVAETATLVAMPRGRTSRRSRETHRG